MDPPIQILEFFMLIISTSVIWRLQWCVVYLFDFKNLKDKDFTMFTINYIQESWEHNVIS
jgi:hypothetical protein